MRNVMLYHFVRKYVQYFERSYVQIVYAIMYNFVRNCVQNRTILYIIAYKIVRNVTNV